jgi:hypothetical protein
MIKEYLLVVQNDPLHDLRLGLRRRLWCSFDGAGADRHPPSGHRRRIKLAVLAVQKVLPIWEAAFPADRTPHHALNLIEKLLVGGVTAAAAEKESDDMGTHLDNLGYRHGEQLAIGVGYAANTALMGALWDDEVFGKI